MATRAKPREIVIESQKVFGVINKGLKWIGIVVAIATVVAVVSLGVRDLPHEELLKQVVSHVKEIPLASSPQSSWPTLAIPAKGKLELIPHLYSQYPAARVAGMRVKVTGSKDSFRLHIVYADGNECVIPDEACASDGLVGMYVTNELSEINLISYAFSRI